MGAGRWTWPPGETLRARLAMCGLWVVRASIPAPRTNGAQTMSTLSIKSRNPKSVTPKKTVTRRSLSQAVPSRLRPHAGPKATQPQKPDTRLEGAEQIRR